MVEGGESKEKPQCSSGFVDCVYWVQDVISCYGQRAVWLPDLEEALWAEGYLTDWTPGTVLWGA